MTVLPIILASASTPPKMLGAAAGTYSSGDFCDILCKLTCDVSMGTSCSNQETAQNVYLEACGQDCKNLLRTNNNGDLVVDGNITSKGIITGQTVNSEQDIVAARSVRSTSTLFVGGQNTTNAWDPAAGVRANGVSVTDGTYSLHNTKGTGYQNFLLQSDPAGYDTILTLGGGANTVTVKGNISSTGSVSGKTINAAQDIVATGSVRSTSTLFVGSEDNNNKTPNQWNPSTNGGTLSAGVLQVNSNSDQAIQCANGSYPCQMKNLTLL